MTGDMRILLIGKNGQLGWELNRSLSRLGEVNAVDSPEIDLERPETVQAMIAPTEPAIIVNAAAYTAVDQAEVEQEKAWRINALAPGILAEEAKRRRALFIHYSTDYVFDGSKGSPYSETDQPNPLNYYGQSKLGGDHLVQEKGAAYLILRTSWVYSLRQQAGFVRKVLEWARKNETLRIVDDQIANPTWARMLAEVTAQLLAHGEAVIRDRSGVYNLAGSGFVSRFEWAKKVLELDPNKHEQIARLVERAGSVDFPTPARRPLFSALDCSKISKVFGVKPPAWEDSLRLAMTGE
jgi:dTDP-4-dehydrorhamnose reductase